MTTFFILFFVCFRSRENGQKNSPGAAADSLPQYRGFVKTEY